MATEQVFQVALYLGLIIGLILLLGFVARKIAPQNVASGQGGMKVVSSLSLGMKEKLVMIQVGDKQMLIGVTPNNISRIEQFDEPVVEPGDGLGDFRFKLQEMMQKQG
jgi:flagellar protein FliO/FliZ